MKKFKTLLVLIALIAVVSCDNNTDISKEVDAIMTWEQWKKESTTDIRLLPKYGHVEKTEKQKESDKVFIETILKQDSTHRKGADRFIRLGFNYLYRDDVKTAMYRFNQAYLLDSTNTDIYWGYGGVYMALGQYQKAKEQYKAVPYLLE